MSVPHHFVAFRRCMLKNAARCEQMSERKQLIPGELSVEIRIVHLNTL